MDRNSASEKYRWDLSKIYKNINEYKDDILKVKDNIKLFSKYEDGNYNANSLYELLELYMNTNRIIDKLESYVSLLGDEDTRINKNQELKEEVNNLCNEFIKATYFVDNNILKLNYNLI